MASLGHEKYNGLHIIIKKIRKFFKVEKWYQIVDYFALQILKQKVEISVNIYWC